LNGSIAASAWLLRNLRLPMLSTPLAIAGDATTKVADQAYRCITDHRVRSF